MQPLHSAGAQWWFGVCLGQAIWWANLMVRYLWHSSQIKWCRERHFRKRCLILVSLSFLQGLHCLLSQCHQETVSSPGYSLWIIGLCLVMIPRLLRQQRSTFWCCVKMEQSFLSAQDEGHDPTQRKSLKGYLSFRYFHIWCEQLPFSWQMNCKLIASEKMFSRTFMSTGQNTAETSQLSLHLCHFCRAW